MNLLPKGLEKKFPSLGLTAGLDPKDIPIVAKFFDPTGSWAWYATEGERDGDDFIFFGYVRGFDNELGNFSLSELQEAKCLFGLGIERDLHFKNHKLSEAMKERI